MIRQIRLKDAVLMWLVEEVIHVHVSYLISNVLHCPKLMWQNRHSPSVLVVYIFIHMPDFLEFPIHTHTYTEQKSKRNTFLYTQKIHFSWVSTSPLPRSSIPPHRFGISRCWLDGMIIAQVCLRLATIMGHSQMRKGKSVAFCIFVQCIHH